MSDTTTGPDTGAQPGPPSPMPPAPGGPQGPPGGGGIPPALAAIIRQRMQAQPSQPGMGTQGGAVQKIQMAVDLLQQALPGLGAGSKHHESVLNAIRQLSRHMGEQGAPQQASQQTALQDMLRATIRNAMLQRIIAAQGGGGGAPGAQPSTPMPGA